MFNCRIFGMNPGNYNFNIDALNCVKESDGSCKHNPQKPFSADLSKPSQVWLSKHIEETAIEQEADICARTNSIEKWPPFTKRIWKYKQSIMEQNHNNNRSENEEVQMNIDNNVTHNIQPTQAVNNSTNQSAQKADKSLNLTKVVTKDNSAHKKSDIQINSTHFDIRSSPIKSQQSGVFSHFQINLSKLPKFEGQLLRPQMFSETNDQNKSENTLEGMFQHLTSKSNISSNAIGIMDDLNCKSADNENREVCYDRPKNWTIDNIQSHENYQTNACIEPTMIHIKDVCESAEQIPKHTNEIDGVLNLSDSCLSLNPEPLNDCLNFTELRGNSIEELPLDLFSFNNP